MSTTRTSVVRCAGVVALLVGACTGRAVAPDAAPPPTSVPAVVPTPPPDADLASAMGDHFDAIREIQLGVIHGLLGHAQERAGWLATHLEAPGQEARRTELAVVRLEAEALAATTDLAAAARQTARLGGACAACHLAASATTTFAYEPLPEKVTTLAERMHRHRWAAGRMWEGLVGPSTELWRTGAETLARAPLIEDPRLAALPRAPELKALAERVQRLARAASVADDQDVRVETYGELLATCSGCHAIAWPAVRAK